MVQYNICMNITVFSALKLKKKELIILSFFSFIHTNKSKTSLYIRAINLKRINLQNIAVAPVLSCLAHSEVTNFLQFPFVFYFECMSKEQSFCSSTISHWPASFDTSITQLFGCAPPGDQENDALTV